MPCRAALAAGGRAGVLGLVTLTAAAQTRMLDTPAVRPALTPLAGLPLYFEANHGQPDGQAQFLARGGNCQFLITPTEVQLALRRVDNVAPAWPFERDKLVAARMVLTKMAKMQFVGANGQARLHSEEEMPGKINYLIGNDPTKWHAGMATYAKVQVEEVYPGINLVYYGNQQQLEYDFIIAPGADPGAIAIHFEGADKVTISEQGELVLGLGADEIRQPRPVLYQMVGGVRKEINGGYRLKDARTVQFTVGKYDHDLPLVIDPVLSYSTYLGGNVGDVAVAVKVGSTGAVYVAGITLSSQFPFTIPPGSYTNKFQGGTFDGDVFVAKFDSTLTNLVYFTYLGGSSEDGAYDVALDSSDNVYLTGFTDSPDFPVVPSGVGVLGLANHISGTPDTNAPHAYPVDGFVTELDASGSSLVYSAYLGGSDKDVGDGIAVDGLGNAYVTGYTYSKDFPTTNAYQSYLGGTNNTVNAFLAKIAPGGANLAYSTYFGGTNFDRGEGVAVEPGGVDGLAYVTGYTGSTNFPWTADALQTQFNHSTNAEIKFQNAVSVPFDAFVAKFDTTLSGSNSLAYLTLLGGTNSDAGNRITVDALANVYVTGYSESPDFPDTTTNHVAIRVGADGTNFFNSDAFLTKIDFGTTPPALRYSMLFGGNNNDMGWDVTVDAAGNYAFVVGVTASTNFPTTNAPDATGLLRATNSGGNDVFVTVFTNDATELAYSAYLGGSRDDYGFGIAADPAGNAYVIGRTLSTNFPELTPFASPLQRTNDAFLAKISLGVPPMLSAVAKGGDLLVKWPGFVPEYELEMCTNLAGTNWTAVSQSQGASNGWQTITLDTTNSSQFFRLHKY